MLKKVILLGLVLSSLMMALSPAFAERARRAPRAKVAQQAKTINDPKSEFSTSMSFEGKAIKGKVQNGSLRKIVVENDKSIDDLLGVRRHFDDREEQEGERNATW